MAKLPRPPRIQKRAHKTNTTAQYEALGRFVEAFELMVDETRRVSIKIIKRDDQHEKLVEVIFHADSMTARPLFDIMKALIVEWVKQPFLKVKQSDRDNISGILKEIATNYTDLANTRNMLLHGTWGIGTYNLDDPKFETFNLKKYRLTKAGLEKAGKIPNNAAGLLALRDRCDKVRWWIKFVGLCLPPTRDRTLLAKTFKFEDGQWRLTGGGPQLETLP
jgi:hypothetical protein